MTTTSPTADVVYVEMLFTGAERVAPVDAAPNEHGVDRRRRHTELAGDSDRPEPLAPAQRHDCLRLDKGRLGETAAWA